MPNCLHTALLAPESGTYSLQARLTHITDTVCYVLVVLGIVGNLLGLFIFSLSRRTRRISSTYVYLATCSSITNLLCVVRYASILHSTSRNILHQLVEQTRWACKIYEFSFSFRVISAWITVCWMFERLICVSKKLRAFFNRCNSYKLKFIIPIIIMSIILIIVIGPPVYMYKPEIIPNNDTMKSTLNILCCQLHSNASVRWQKYFHEIRLGINHYTIRCLFSELIPTGAIILFNSYIVYQMRRAYRRLQQTNGHQLQKEQSRTASWMNIVLILHSVLFLASLFSHIIGHFAVIEAHETWWVVLMVLINCSLNFYVYCLSGKAFRNEIRRFIKQLKRRLFNRSQTQQQQSYQRQRFIYEMSNFQGIVQLRPKRR